MQATDAAQAPLIAKAKHDGGTAIRALHVANAFAVTISTAGAADLAADPAVASVVADRQIAATPAATPTAPAPAKLASPQILAPTRAPAASTVCPSDPKKPLLEPEALQATHTAFSDTSTPSAQQIATGKGVTVAFLADGLDPNNPDFIRADGSHVFIDYQDFSGEGPNAPTSGAEAFGDASSIAAQGRQMYDLSTFVNPAHPLPAGCNIQRPRHGTWRVAGRAEDLPGRRVRLQLRDPRRPRLGGHRTTTPTSSTSRSAATSSPTPLTTRPRSSTKSS